ncbi:MAG: hypothetical protein JW837_05945 [Sedimentisphaerales bacterium]|nr:hypothetical protein [Sedimentisphaerales bacterium]
MTKQRRMIFIFYGILLGACMGALSSSSSIILWFHFERPDFLIRPDWLEISIPFLIISGAFIGSIFGTHLCSMKSHPNTHMKWLLSHILMLIGASSVYFGFDYLAIKWRVMALHFASHLLVFFWCLAIIYFLGGNWQRRATNS